MKEPRLARSRLKLKRVQADLETVWLILTGLYKAEARFDLVNGWWDNFTHFNGFLFFCIFSCPKEDEEKKWVEAQAWVVLIIKDWKTKSITLSDTIFTYSPQFNIKKSQDRDSCPVLSLPLLPLVLQWTQHPSLSLSLSLPGVAKIHLL